MGCVSSSLLNQDEDFSHNFSQHIVSLTSTTYGLLTMEPPTPVQPPPSRRKPLFPALLCEPHSVKYDSFDSIHSWDLMSGIDFRSFAKKPTSFLIKDGVFDGNNRILDEEKCFLEKPICQLDKDGENVGLIEEFEKVSQENSLLEKTSSQLDKGGIFDEKSVGLIEGFGEKGLLEKPTSQLAKDRIFDEKSVSLIESFGENGLPTSQLAKDRIFDEKSVSLIAKFEKSCPPNGVNKAVMYSTTLRGVRKTFEDCNAVRAAVEGHGVLVSERDVSMDRGFREELKVLMDGKGDGEMTLPRLFVKGRYIGGVEEVMGALEDGYLAELLEGLPKVVRGYVCEGCGGGRFLPCFTCSGSCKRLVEGFEVDGKEVGDDVVVKCGDCNENGLVHCPVCT